MNDQYVHGEAELRMALHGLRRDIAPERDLWPGIAQRLQPQSSVAVRQSRGWPLALAASMLLALGLTWQVDTQPARPIPVGQPVSGALPTQAEALTLHYEAALREFDMAAVPGSWQASLQVLDHSAEQVLIALRQQPDSQSLLDRLRRIYARRIALSRRAIFALGA